LEIVAVEEVLPRRHADDPFELPGQVALIREADGERDLHDRAAAAEETPGARDTNLLVSLTRTLVHDSIVTLASFLILQTGSSDRTGSGSLLTARRS
jgi:hypothetical protein